MKFNELYEQYISEGKYKVKGRKRPVSPRERRARKNAAKDASVFKSLQAALGKDLIKAKELYRNATKKIGKSSISTKDSFTLEQSRLYNEYRKSLSEEERSLLDKFIKANDAAKKE
jgi:uncharacterized phage protein gp47/JayE